MANTIEWGLILQQKLDEQLIQGATSGWMEANAGQVKYEGGKEVKVPIMNVQGLGDYGRNTTGYPVGDVDLRYQTFEMRMDRGREFNFDRHDVDESNYIVNAGNVLSVFQKTKVIPEIDAYRYSTIADVAITAGFTGDYTPSEADILSKLLDDIITIQDRTGTDNLVIIINQLVAGVLAKSKEYARIVDTANFSRGGLELKVKAIDGIPLLPVPSVRMKTKYIFNDGVTAGQTVGGFTPDATAKDLNWIICPRTAPLAISKTDKVKIWTPDQNQDLDSWKTQYRKYHDCWVMENVVPAFQVNKQA